MNLILIYSYQNIRIIPYFLLIQHYQAKKLKTYHAKVVLIGEGGVGKTTSIIRYIENRFRSDYVATVGFSILNKTIQCKQSNVSIQFWDFSGQSQYEKMRAKFYIGTYAAMLMFDVTSKESFDAIDKWIKEVKINTGHNVPIVLVGNKIDLTMHRIISSEMIEKKKEGYPQIVGVYETSALTGENINNAFQFLAETIEDLMIIKEEEKTA